MKTFKSYMGDIFASLAFAAIGVVSGLSAVAGAIVDDVVYFVSSLFSLAVQVIPRIASKVPRSFNSLKARLSSFKSRLLARVHFDPGRSFA